MNSNTPEEKELLLLISSLFKDIPGGPTIVIRRPRAPNPWLVFFSVGAAALWALSHVTFGGGDWFLRTLGAVVAAVIVTAMADQSARITIGVGYVHLDGEHHKSLKDFYTSHPWLTPQLILRALLEHQEPLVEENDRLKARLDQSRRIFGEMNARLQAVESVDPKQIEKIPS